MKQPWEFEIEHDPIKAARGMGYAVTRLSLRNIVDREDYAQGYRFRLTKKVSGEVIPEIVMARNEAEIATFLKRKLAGPVKGEQTGMLGVPSKVHTQKRPYTPGQMEFESYGKLKAAKEQTTVPEEMKLLPNAKQNLYWWTVEQLRGECIRQRLIDPTKRYHKKELIDLLEPGMGTHPPFPRKPGQVWEPVKHIWVDV